ncbi:MAG: flagellar hook-length control protein FliK [Nitrospirae bacterium]|nr:MAG: flagellar hook-length control protein FliK [Nitrospirota bacterium]
MDASNLLNVTPDSSLGMEAGGQAAASSAASPANTGKRSFGTILAHLESGQDQSTAQVMTDDPNAILLASLQTLQVSQLSIAMPPASAPAVSVVSGEKGQGQLGKVAIGTDVPLGAELAGISQTIALGNAQGVLPTLGGTQAIVSLPVSTAQGEHLGQEVKTALAGGTQQASVPDKTGVITMDEKISRTDESVLAPTVPTPTVPEAKNLSKTGEESSPVPKADSPASAQPDPLKNATTVVQPGEQPKVVERGRPAQPQSMPGAKAYDDGAKKDMVDVTVERAEKKTGATQGDTKGIDRAGQELARHSDAAQPMEKDKGVGKESKGPALPQGVGAEKMLAGMAQPEGLGAKPAPAPQAPSPVQSIPSDPAVSHSQPSIQVDVNPADLGRVQVRVVLSDQTVHANVTTERAGVGEFLAANQGRLEAGFSASGLQLGEFKVTVDSQGRGSFGQPDFSGSYGPGQNAYGQGRGTQEQTGRFTQGSDRPGEVAEGRPFASVSSWDSRGLSLFA